MTMHRQPTTLKIRSKLDTVLGDDWAVGLSAVPQVPGATPNTWVPVSLPYVILYPLWTKPSGPPFGANRHDDAEWTYQVTCLALRGDQLEWVRDRVIAAFLATNPDGSYVHDLAGDGVKIMERAMADDTGSGEAAPGVSALPSDLRFRLHVTPADT